jgi:hypothetical protein
MVLGLVGLAPMGAQAEEWVGVPRLEPGAIVVESSVTDSRSPSSHAARKPSARRAGPGTGGSGQSPSAQAWAQVPNEQVFVGAVRSVTKDRLLLEGPSQRMYEFGLGVQTRILGPDGAAVPLQSLQEGIPVRTVTRPGEVENQVISLRVLEQTHAPHP